MWTAAGSFSAFFLAYSTMVPISIDQGLSPMTGGTVLTAMMICVVIVQPVAPALQNRWGPRAAVGLALTLQAAGQALGLLVPHPLTALLLAGLAGGLGFGLLVVLATAAVPVVADPARVGRVLGLFGAVTAASAAVGAPMGRWLSTVVPLDAFRLIAGVTVLIALLALPAIPARTGNPASGHRSTGDRSTGRATAGAASTTGDGTRAELGRLVPVLFPFLIATVAFGLVIAFGPGSGAGHPALLIAAMQASSVGGRWLAGALTDRFRAAEVCSVGIVLAAAGLVATAIASSGWMLALCLVALGAGIGAVQSASLVMCFAIARTAGRGSVWWNMNYDIGLALAGLVGGFGFTHLGAPATFMACAVLLLVAGLAFRARIRR